MNPVRNFPFLGHIIGECKLSNGVNEKAADMIPDENTHLLVSAEAEAVAGLDELQNLLEKQIELVHQGGVIDSERLSTQASRLVGKIAQAGILELSEFKSRREHLQKLYEDLCLAITTECADVAEKLSQVRKGKKIIQIYRKNI